jgi:hypothetical protein
MSRHAMDELLHHLPHYVREADGTIRRTYSYEEFVRYWEDRALCVIEQTDVVEGSAAAFVSTVFLGRDHGFGHGPPVLFETMVKWPDEGYRDQMRYVAEDKARVGHALMVEYVRCKLRQDKTGAMKFMAQIRENR